MAAKWFELVTGSLDQKKHYRQYVARIDALPEPYDAVAKALQRYLTFYGGIVDGETSLKMLSDFVDLGDDPVEFAEAFADAYSGRQWIDKERARLVKAVAAVEAVEDAERGERG